MSCTSCDLSVQNKYSCKTDCLTDNKFKKCFGEIIPAAIASLNIGNDKFNVKSTFNYLGDTIDQCGGCSDAVSTNIVSSWKAFWELLLILTNCAIQTKLPRNVYSICVRKMLLHGSKTWPVVTEVVQWCLLLTVVWSERLVVCPWKIPFQW